MFSSLQRRLCTSVSYGVHSCCSPLSGQCLAATLPWGKPSGLVPMRPFGGLGCQLPPTRWAYCLRLAGLRASWTSLCVIHQPVRECSSAYSDGSLSGVLPTCCRFVRPAGFPIVSSVSCASFLSMLLGFQVLALGFSGPSWRSFAECAHGARQPVSVSPPACSSGSLSGARLPVTAYAACTGPLSGL